MLKIYNYSELTKRQIFELINRNPLNDASINDSVIDIINKVKQGGDKALYELELLYDNVSLNKLFLNSSQLKQLAQGVEASEKKAIQTAFQNIFRFHKNQFVPEKKIAVMPGITCWREIRPIEKVGLYIPGGTAPLPSTLLMLVIPAKIAGCKEITVCTPPKSINDGLIDKYIAYCALLCEIDRLYMVGGAQAIAAMAYGTETIPKVSKIFGPGNRFVTQAKTILQSQGHISIDMPAGPSEVLIIADNSAVPEFIAADLLSQAEHGNDSQVVLLADNMTVIEKVKKSLNSQLRKLTRKSIIKNSLADSYAICVSSIDEAIKFSNNYAPEHLILTVKNYQKWTEKIQNAGSVFLGNYTPESAGDYATGTNHTLPTSGYAKSYSGVSVDSFFKKITFQHLSQAGFKKICTTAEKFAQIEGLDAHKNSITIRKKFLTK